LSEWTVTEEGRAYKKKINAAVHAALRQLSFLDSGSLRFTWHGYRAVL
jgi:hypothetical protein